MNHFQKGWNEYAEKKEIEDARSDSVRLGTQKHRVEPRQFSLLEAATWGPSEFGTVSLTSLV